MAETESQPPMVNPPPLPSPVAGLSPAGNLAAGNPTAGNSTVASDNGTLANGANGSTIDYQPKPWLSQSLETSQQASSPEQQPDDRFDELPLIDVTTIVRESPPWLASAVVHMLVLILFGLFLRGSTVTRPLTLEIYAEEIGEQLIEESLDLSAATELDLDAQVLSPEALPEVEMPLAMPEIATPLLSGNTASSNQTSETIGIALSGRTPGMKEALLKSFGGTSTTEQAVMDGLRWLARKQLKSGLWSLSGSNYKDGAKVENKSAGTAMALLAFQGAGFTHQGDSTHPFAPVVKRGWQAFLKRQGKNGSFFREGAFNHELYTHAQATIALCELYGMTRDEELREPAQRAIDYAVGAQSDSGGWRYEANVGGDLSVTGWFIMALQSGRMAGLEVPSETFFKASKFIDRCSRQEGSRYGYMPRDAPKLSMTAEGLLCRQYLGWARDDDRLNNGVYYLLDNLPSMQRGKRDVYYWYYATQVLHHMEGDAWQRWNRVMRQLLPEQQVQTGRERGSWGIEIDEVHGKAGGRLYTTCLAIYILEVYYRHLPIYQQELLGEF